MTAVISTVIMLQGQVLSGGEFNEMVFDGINSDDSTVAELTAELSSHKMKLSERVVEGYGDKTEEIGEIIEDTFKDKKIASKFGEKEAETVTSTTTLDLSVVEEEDSVINDESVEGSSPHKRKINLAEKESAVDLSSGEVADVEVVYHRIIQRYCKPFLPRTMLPTPMIPLVFQQRGREWEPLTFPPPARCWSLQPQVLGSTSLELPTFLRRAVKMSLCK